MCIRDRAYIALGHDFVEDMTEEQITAAAGILEDCGCADGPLEMPVLAQGGIVPGGARVLVGEGGPGYIVPLSAPSDQNRELIAQIARGDVSFAPGSAEASPATAAGGLSAERGFTTSPAPTAGTSGLSMESVSYTHLTLPTKRIV